MFVSVLQKDGSVTSIYECDQVHIHNHSDDLVSFQLQRDGKGETVRDLWIEINKKNGSEVYLMNDSGKTIDTYRWDYPDYDSKQKELPPKPEREQIAEVLEEAVREAIRAP